MGLLRWLRRRIVPQDGPQATQSSVGEATEIRGNGGREEVIHRAQLFVDQVNDSIRISVNSKNPGTKVSRLEFARARLDELEALCAENPYITITAHAAVRHQMERLTREYADAGYYALTEADQRDYRHQRSDLRLAALDSVIDGHLFCATMQMRTPLRFLLAHNTRHDGPLPAGTEVPLRHGIWMPALVGQKVFSGTMASEIGPIPADGGNYLRFLIEARRIVEQHTPVDQRRIELKSLLGRDEHKEFIRRRGPQAIADQFFPPFLMTIQGLAPASVERLWEMGLTTPKALAAAEDKDLSAVKGIGKAKLRSIRDACAAASDMDSEFVEQVER